MARLSAAGGDMPTILLAKTSMVRYRHVSEKGRLGAFVGARSYSYPYEQR
jgi:hypothetical protein